MTRVKSRELHYDVMKTNFFLKSESVFPVKSSNLEKFIRMYNHMFNCVVFTSIWLSCPEMSLICNFRA